MNEYDISSLFEFLVEEEFTYQNIIETSRIRGIAAIHGYRFDSVTIKDYLEDLKRKAVEIHAKDFSLLPETEGILSSFACGHEDINSQNSIPSLVRQSAVIIMKHIVRNKNMELGGEGWEVLKGVIDENGNVNNKKVESKISDFGKLIAFTYNAAKLEDSIKSYSEDFEIDKNYDNPEKELSALEIAYAFYYLNESGDYAPGIGSRESDHWKFCTDTFGNKSVDNIRKNYKVLNVFEELRLSRDQAVLKIQNVISYLQNNHPQYQKSIHLAQEELAKAQNFR